MLARADAWLFTCPAAVPEVHYGRVLTICAAVIVGGAFAASPALALTGVVLYASTRVPVGNAEVLVVGQRGSVRTAVDGRFEWALPDVAPFTVLVVLPDGRLARPIRVEAFDAAGEVTLLVEPAVAQTVDVIGSAPAVDVSPAAVASFVTAADIRLRQPATLGHILENVAGVSMISEGQSATPAIRGLARGRTSILVDGSRASSERRAGPNASFLDPAIVERVDVARGPASVAYGSDAMGGVIAVRTRRPDYRRGLRTRFLGGLGGGVPQARGDLEVSGGYGSGGVLVGVRSRDFGSYESPRGPVPNSGWRDEGLRLRWEHGTEAGAWAIGWQSDRARDIGRPRSDADTVRVSSPLEDVHRFTFSYERATLAGFRRVRLDALLGSVRQQTEQDRLASNTRALSVELADVRSREFQLRTTADRPLRRVRLQVGADVDGRYALEASDTVRSYDPGGTLLAAQTTPSIAHAHRTNAGLFTQADVQPTRRIRLSGGIRGDVVHSVNSGGYFGDRRVTSPALAGSAAVTLIPAPRTTITAQLSRGFREPMLSDRFYRGPVGRGFIEGNPDLEPETSRQADVLVRYDAGPLTLAGAVYEYRIFNLIERYQSSATSFRFRNRGVARLHGADVEAGMALSPGLTLTLAGQVSRGRDAHDGTPLDDVAPAAVRLVVRQHARRFDSYLKLGVVARHDAAGPSEVPMPGAATVDAGAGVQIGRGLQLLALGRNLTAAAFPSSTGPRWVYAPGRQASISLMLTF